MLKPTAEIRLPGAVVLVTGGAGGIGAGITRSFLRGGAEVVICGRTTPSELPGADGRSAQFMTCDVRDPEAVTRLFGEIAARHGRLDVR
jgi:NAD(P)-dependent dehydrogenase (short-subunit alcohol dehydrogenase family)